MERLSSDNSFSPLRSTSTRDLERFIEICGDGNDCLKKLEKIKRGTLDRLDGGHLVNSRSWTQQSAQGSKSKRVKDLEKKSSQINIGMRGTLDRLGGTVFVKQPIRLGGTRYVKYAVQNNNKYNIPFKYQWNDLVESDTAISGFGEDYYGELAGSRNNIDNCWDCSPKETLNSYSSILM
ncbi:uncharacterized protein LOC126908561 isoform X2 [Daktulosphaira vitifoliae]|nr:uncharacterized protein LOC126908561 isoform X2 [Daktulosphaira vitifoliae]XP_050546697.1 uncharacterized protein LOC126908561 isoform X2 [Daktulosphaira vitifoliae]